MAPPARRLSPSSSQRNALMILDPDKFSTDPNERLPRPLKPGPNEVLDVEQCETVHAFTVDQLARNYDLSPREKSMMSQTQDTARRAMESPTPERRGAVTANLKTLYSASFWSRKVPDPEDRDDMINEMSQAIFWYERKRLLAAHGDYLAIILQAVRNVGEKVSKERSRLLEKQAKIKTSTEEKLGRSMKDEGEGKDEDSKTREELAQLEQDRAKVNSELKKLGHLEIKPESESLHPRPNFHAVGWYRVESNLKKEQRIRRFHPLASTPWTDFYRVVQDRMNLRGDMLLPMIEVYVERNEYCHDDESRKMIADRDWTALSRWFAANRVEIEESKIFDDDPRTRTALLTGLEWIAGSYFDNISEDPDETIVTKEVHEEDLQIEADKITARYSSDAYPGPFPTEEQMRVLLGSCEKYSKEDIEFTHSYIFERRKQIKKKELDDQAKREKQHKKALSIEEARSREIDAEDKAVRLLGAI